MCNSNDKCPDCGRIWDDRGTQPCEKCFDNYMKDDNDHPQTVDENVDNTNLRNHMCDPNNSWAEYDAQGIYLCRVCDLCVDAKLSRYRPEILEGYGQADVDERIEED